MCPLGLLFFALLQVDRSEKLNASLDVQVVLGDVEAFEVTSSGGWVVYRAPEESTTPGLYVTATDGSTPSVLLSEPGTSVGSFALNTAGTRVVFVSGPNLYRAGSTGGRVQLNPSLVAGGAVVDFALSPDGTRAVYRADQEVDGRIDLYSVNLVGAPASVRLSRVLGPGNGVHAYRIAPDGQRVAFAGDLVVSGRIEVFSAPIDGSLGDTALCGAFVAGGSVSYASLAVTSDSSRALYLADQLVNEKVELFSVPLDGSGTALRLNEPLPATADVSGFQSAAARVVFLADGLVDNRPELYSAPVDASVPAVQINGSQTPVVGYALASSGAAVAFHSVYCGGLSSRLFGVPADGSAAPIELGNHPPSSRCLSRLSITPDSTAAVYALRYGATDEVLRVPLDGSAPPAQLLVPIGDVSDYRYTLDGQGLVIRSDTGAARLFLVPLDASAPATELFAMPDGRAGVEADFALAGTEVFFRADLASHDVLELHATPLDASQAPRRLSEDLATTPTTVDVTSLAVAPDRSFAGYTTTLGAYAVELTPELTTRELMRSDTAPYGYRSIAITADSSRLFWVAPALGLHLFTKPFDAGPITQLSSGVFADGFGVGSASFSPDGSFFTFGYHLYEPPSGRYTGATDLSSPVRFLSGATMSGLTYTADGSQIVYGFRQYNPFSLTPSQFFLRPADASAPGIELASGPLGWPGWSPDHELTSDETRLVYVRDDEVQGKLELFSVTLLPGASPVKLSGALAAGRSVAGGVTLTPDGTRALFLADRDTAGAFELYIVPVDGSAVPLELSGTLVSGGDVNFTTSSGAFVWVTPDSTRALYVADALVNDRFDLYSVALDGSEAPMLLAAAQVTGGDVDPDRAGFQLTPSGTRMVFRGDLLANGLNELFSVAVTGGPLVRVSGTLQANGGVQLPFTLLEGRQEVLYRADAVLDERFELWLAPVHFAGRPAARSHLAHAAGDVDPVFVVDSAEEHVYYRADALEDERIEFFRFPLHPVPHVRQR